MIGRDPDGTTGTTITTTITITGTMDPGIIRGVHPSTGTIGGTVIPY